MFKLIFSVNKCASLEKFVYQITQKRCRCLVSPSSSPWRYCKKGLEYGRKNYSRLPPGHMLKVFACLKEHNLDLSNIGKTQMYQKFREPLWVLERKILFLEEIGVPTIKFNYLDNMPKALTMPVYLFKAQTSIPADFNIAKNLLSHVKDSKTKVDYKELNHVNEDMNLQTYVDECALYFLKSRFVDVDEKSLRQIAKGYRAIASRIKSFRNWKKQLDFLQQELKLSNEFILKHHWLLQVPSKLSSVNVQVIRDHLKGFDVANGIKKCPEILSTDTSNLKKLMITFKSYHISNEMINNCPAILILTFDRFYNRYQSLIKNPYTLVYQNHPRFLLMVQNYKTLVPRVNYLKENDVKFASLDGLTASRDVSQELGVNKRTNGASIKCFLKKQFNAPATTLILDLKKHPYYRYVPLTRMYETLVYLRTIFTSELIEQHIYCLLYDKADIEAARQELRQSDDKEQMLYKNMLPRCIYEIEKKFGFTGKGVLSRLKFKNQNVANSKEEVLKNVVEPPAAGNNCDNAEEDEKPTSLLLKPEVVEVSKTENSGKEHLNLAKEAQNHAEKCELLEPEILNTVSEKEERGTFEKEHLTEEVQINDEKLNAQGETVVAGNNVYFNFFKDYFRK